MRDSICNDCAERTRCDMAEIGRSPLAISTCYCYKKGNPTNADRIRAMTDEELAEFIGNCVDHEFHLECICFLNRSGYCQYPTRGCNENALEWLKQEVET